MSKIAAIEEISDRCPHLFENILELIDDESLVTLKFSSRKLCQRIKETSCYWLRIIRRLGKDRVRRSKILFHGKFETIVDPRLSESWKNVIEKAPVEIVKELALALQDFLNLPCKCATISCSQRPIDQDSLHKVGIYPCIQGNLLKGNDGKKRGYRAY